MGKVAAITAVLAVSTLYVALKPFGSTVERIEDGSKKEHGEEEKGHVYIISWSKVQMNC